MILPTLSGDIFWPRDGRISKRMLWLVLLLMGMVVVVALCWHSVFIVDETQSALLLSFGRQVREPIVEAGLYVKRPWQKVHIFDRRSRLLVLEPRPMITCNHEHVVIQPYTCWRVAAEGLDRYLKSAVDRTGAEAVLADLIWGSLDRELAEHALTDWIDLSADDTGNDPLPQTQLLNRVTHACRQEAYRQFGIELLDVRLYRVTRPEWMKADIYRRMIADRQRIADEMRQAGADKVTQMKSTARQSADQLITQAKTQADTIRLQAKAQADRILSNARALDPELMVLAETLDSYRSLLSSHATLVLSGDPELFGIPTASQPE